MLYGSDEKAWKTLEILARSMTEPKNVPPYLNGERAKIEAKTILLHIVGFTPPSKEFYGYTRKSGPSRRGNPATRPANKGTGGSPAGLRKRWKHE